MNNTYSIMLIGLDTEQETIASAHLSLSGHNVVSVGKVAEAEEKLKAKRIDLLYLQHTSNSEAGGRIKRILNLCPSLPVVMICSRAEESFVLEVWRAGASDILLSPITPQSLDDSLHRNLPQNSTTGETGQDSSPTARLIYYDRFGKEFSIPVTPPRTTIGRSSGNDLVIGQMEVSRSHAEVLVLDGKYLLRDLGSKMGTFVNGSKVEQIGLTHGDRIHLGGLQGPMISFNTGDILQTLLSRTDSDDQIGLSLHGFKEIGKLFAAFRALSSIPVLDDLLAVVVDTAIELMGAERGFIMLKEKNGELDFRCARNNNKQSLDGDCFQTSQRVPHDVFSNGRPVVIKDLDYGTEDESHHFTRQLGLRSISCVPLRYITVRDSGITSTVARSETIGVLYVDSSNIAARMSDSRIDALETLASEAAMAIYNARLYKDSQDKRRIDEQLSVAHEIQQALLPSPTKDLDYLRACSCSLPCYEIGGDYFDYFVLGNGHFGFALGDVAGKGMPAAILAALIQGMFASQNLLQDSLASIIEKVNRNLVQRGTGNRFVTFFFGILDPEGNCTYVNAGHNPPFLLSRDGSMKELLSGGMVLGLFSNTQYETGTIQVQPGDHLVLFTDGVVEALDKSGEEYGLTRLKELLQSNARSSTEEILSHLNDSVLSFSADAPQHDDITMMIIGYRE